MRYKGAPEKPAPPFALKLKSTDVSVIIIKKRKKGVLIMTEKEQAAVLIDVYTDLQRIQKAPDRDKELANQLRKAKAKLEALGIVTENLIIE